MQAAMAKAFSEPECTTFNVLTLGRDPYKGDAPNVCLGLVVHLPSIVTGPLNRMATLFVVQQIQCLQTAARLALGKQQDCLVCQPKDWRQNG